MAATLGRLTVNIGGSRENRCRVYASVVMSIVLYGALTVDTDRKDDRRIGHRMEQLQRRLSLRTIRTYRTVSNEAVAILARAVPFRFMADRLKRTHLRRCEALRKDSFILSGD